MVFFQLKELFHFTYTLSQGEILTLPLYEYHYFRIDLTNCSFHFDIIGNTIFNFLYKTIFLGVEELK